MGIRVFLLFPALVLGHGGELGRGLSYLKCYPGNTFSCNVHSLAFINTELNLPAKCQLPNFICHCTDLAHCGSSCCQILWPQYQEQEESPLCDLHCCWCQSAWQQVGRSSASTM